jgi:hypothetical protein
MRRPTLVLLGLLVAVVAAGSGLLVSQRSGDARFCNAAAAIVEINGEPVFLEDQGAPGEDGCDADQAAMNATVLGQDCKLRAPGGDVIDELEPNRADGTCGQPDPGGRFPGS